MFRTRDNLVSSSGVMRAAATSTDMLSAAICLAALSLGDHDASAHSPPSLDRHTGNSRLLGRAEGSISYILGPAEGPPAPDLADDGCVLGGGGVDAGSVADAEAASALSRGGEAAAVERSHSPYDPHRRGQGNQRKKEGLEPKEGEVQSRPNLELSLVSAFPVLKF